MVETDVTTIKLTGLAPNTQVRADTLLWYLMIILMKANVMMNMIITWLINDRTESTMAMMIDICCFVNKHRERFDDQLSFTQYALYTTAVSSTSSDPALSCEVQRHPCHHHVSHWHTQSNHELLGHLHHNQCVQLSVRCPWWGRSSS